MTQAARKTLKLPKKDYKVADMELADWGRKEIVLAEKENETWQEQRCLHF